MNEQPEMLTGMWKTLAGALLGAVLTLAIMWVTLSGRYVTREDLRDTDRAQTAEIRAMLDIVKTVQIEQARMTVKLDAIADRLKGDGRGR